MKVLFATDGGKQSDAGIAALKRLAFSEGDEVKILSVIDMAVPTAIDIYGGYLPDTSDLEKAARENAQRSIDDSAAKINDFGVPGLQVSTEILFGSPDSRIVETAEAWGADLIVVGSHGYSRWERLLLGSVSDSVVHHSPCSVWVVRTAKD